MPAKHDIKFILVIFIKILPQIFNLNFPQASVSPQILNFPPNFNLNFSLKFEIKIFHEIPL